jgi:hypothetical protein
MANQKQKAEDSQKNEEKVTEKGKKKEKRPPIKFDSCKMLQLPLKDLNTDLPFQRTRRNESTIRNIVRGFDATRLGVIEVSFRDGAYNVVDGKHRLIALRQLIDLGKLEIDKKIGDYPVNCLVYRGLTAEDEARKFSEQQDNTKRLSQIDKIVGEYHATYEDAIRLVDTLESFELILTNSAGMGNVMCGAKIKFVHERLSQEEFEEFLRILTKAWERDKESLRGEIIGGLYEFYVAYARDIKVGFDVTRLIDVLRRESPLLIVGNGKIDANTKGDHRFARAIWVLYNQNLSKAKKLPVRF